MCASDPSPFLSKPVYSPLPFPPPVNAQTHVASDVAASASPRSRRCRRQSVTPTTASVSLVIKELDRISIDYLNPSLLPLEKSDENLINSPERPQSISLVSFAEKVISNCGNSKTSNGFIFACSRVIALVTSTIRVFESIKAAVQVFLKGANSYHLFH